MEAKYKANSMQKQGSPQSPPPPAPPFFWAKLFFVRKIGEYKLLFVNNIWSFGLFIE